MGKLFKKLDLKLNNTNPAEFYMEVILEGKQFELGCLAVGHRFIL